MSGFKQPGRCRFHRKKYLPTDTDDRTRKKGAFHRLSTAELIACFDNGVYAIDTEQHMNAVYGDQHPAEVDLKAQAYCSDNRRAVIPPSPICILSRPSSCNRRGISMNPLPHRRSIKTIWLTAFDRGGLHSLGILYYLNSRDRYPSVPSACLCFSAA